MNVEAVAQQTVYVSSFAKGLEPDPLYTVTEWADDRRMLPKSYASEPGPWRTSRVPFLEKVMDTLSPHDPTQEVVFMKSSQVGGTECGLNWIGYIIDVCPSSMMVVYPTLEVAERFSKKKLEPTVDETPCLREKISPARTRDSGNTILSKEFPGGFLVMTGANSPSSMRMLPIRFLMLDEIDSYAEEAGEEGDPVKLAVARTRTYSRKKIFYVSSPTI